MNKRNPGGSISSNTAIFDAKQPPIVASWQYDSQIRAVVATWERQIQKYVPEPVQQDSFESDVNSKFNEPLLLLLIQPIEPLAFCMRWLPLKYGCKWGDYGSRQVANEMLARITGLEPGSWNNYLTSEKGPPIIYKRYLRAIDILWQIQRLLRIPLDRLVA